MSTVTSSLGILIAVLFFAAPDAGLAAQPATLTVNVDFGELLSGTKYEITLNTQYVIRDSRPPKNSSHELDTKSRIAARQPARLTFIAPDVSAGETVMKFEFDRPLPDPPPGMTASYVFPVRLKITPPSNSGLPTVDREGVYTTPLVVPSGRRCLRLRGPTRDGYFLIGVGDCTQPVSKPPSHPDKPSH